MSRRTRSQWWSFRRHSQHLHSNARIAEFGRAHRQPQLGSFARRLGIEPLEDRRLLSITVNTLIDEFDGSIVDQDVSLRDAIAAAVSGDTIVFSESLNYYGSATLGLTLGELVIDKDLTIVGPGANWLTIDASFSDFTPGAQLGDGSRVFNIDDGTSSLRSVSISGLTLTGGDSFGAGGAIFASENLTLRNSVVTGNATSSGPIAGGGGIYSQALSGPANSLNVIDSSITYNNARYFEGGGIRKRSGYLLIENSTISGNSAFDGGGGVSAADQNVNVVIRNSSIRNNVSRGAFSIYDGGGGLFFHRAVATISDSYIAANSVTYGSGGGIYAYASRVTVTGCTITSNSATSRGGGVHTLRGELTLANSNITGNTSLSLGGGIYSRDGAVEISNSALDQNFTNGAGGGITSYFGSLNINSSSIRYNSSQTSGGIHRYGDLTISGSLISGNDAHSGRGGGLTLYANYFQGAAFTITNTTISNNRAAVGGGIHKWRGDLTLVDSLISGNNATSGGGGGIYSVQNSLVVIGSAFYFNSAARDGGAVLARGTSVSIDRTTMEGNIATAIGGAISSDGSLSVNSSRLNGNVANIGGAIHQLYGHATINGTTISNNSAIAGVGGGIASRKAGLSLVSSTLSGNFASGSGGGLYLLAVTESPLEIHHSTIAFNRSDAFGGGLFSVGSSLALDHTIVAKNTAPVAADIAGLFGSAITAQFSLIGENPGSPLAEAPIGSPDAHGNLVGGPTFGAIDPLLGFLLENGDPLLYNGARLTMHALLEGSPALDTGDPSAVAGLAGVPAFDQRGGPLWTRVADGDGNGVARIDIGAVEQRALQLVVDTLVDENDGDLSPGDLSLREALALSNGNFGVVDSIHFDPFLAGGTIILRLGDLPIIDGVVIAGLGDEWLTVDASGNDPTPNVQFGDGSRVFTVDTSGAVQISGLTITGGDTFSGGGIYNVGLLTLIESNVSGNDAQHGGGIYSISGAVTVIDSVVSNNRAASTGGGMHIRYSSFSLTGSTISGNTGGFQGGGVYLRGGQATIDHTTIATNSAFTGGGIINRYGYLTLTASTITGNTAQQGGGLYARSGGANIDRSNFTYNSATSGGGGIHFSGFGSFVLANSTVSGNTAATGGGLRLSYGYGLLIHHSTISYNQATGDGGGLYRNGGSLQVLRSTISGNSAQDGGGIFSRFSQLNVIESTLRGNAAEGSGGGLYSFGFTLNLERSTLHGNVASTGGGFASRESNVAVSNATISGNSAHTHGGGGYLFTSGGNSLAIRHSTIHGNNAVTFGGGLAAVGGVLVLDHSIVASGSATYSRDVAMLFGTLDAHFSLIGHFAGSGLAPTPLGPDINGNRIGPMVPTDTWYVYVELAAMGDFEASGAAPDRYVFEYSVDGGAYQPLFTITANEAASQAYFMTNGAQVIREDPLELNGVRLSNYFQGFNAVIPVAGAEVKVRFTATNDGPTEAFAWRNLYVSRQSNGETIGSAVRYSEFDDLYMAYTADPDYSVTGDMFGIRSRFNPGSPGLPNDIADDSYYNFPGDIQGIINEFDGGRFFGVVDTVNGVGSNTNSATWTFTNTLQPIDPRLGQLQDNGGPTWTQLPLEGSPVLDAGDVAAVPGSGNVPGSDQRGPAFQRVVGTIDLGAVELQPDPRPLLAGDYNFDFVVDSADFSVWRDTLYSFVTPYSGADGDGNGQVDAADRIVWKSHFGYRLFGAGSLAPGAAALTATFAATESTPAARLVEVAPPETGSVRVTPIETEPFVLPFEVRPASRSGPSIGPERDRGLRFAARRSDEALSAWLASRAERRAAVVTDDDARILSDATRDESTSTNAIDAVFDALSCRPASPGR